MQVVAPGFVKDKKVLLRYDIDVALRLVFDSEGMNPQAQTRRASLAQGKPSEAGEMVVAEDFKLRAGLDTLKLCLENASKVIVIGHLGRPFKTVDDERQGNPPKLSAKPIKEWFEQALGIEVAFAKSLEEVAASNSKLTLLENTRFFHGEVPGAEYHATCTSKTCDIDFAHRLASLGEVYVNEAFSSHNPAASTTIVPTLLPHAAGLHFAEEVKVLGEVRDPPAGGHKKPFVAIMGGAKVTDKLPVINVLAEKADAVLVGGKLAAEIREQNLSLPKNVMVGKLNADGFDIAAETVSAWSDLIRQSRMIVWNGPVGRIEENTWKVSKDLTFQVEKLGSAKGTYEIAKMVLNSQAEVIIGGGDTVAFFDSVGMLGEFEKKGFVSVGGGAMLKFLADGSLPTISALKVFYS